MVAKINVILNNTGGKTSIMTTIYIDINVIIQAIHLYLTKKNTRVEVF